MVGPGSRDVDRVLDELRLAAVAEHGCEPSLLEGYLPALLAVATTPRRLTEAEKATCRDHGADAAAAGLGLPAAVDLHMTASRLLWPRLSELVGVVRGRPVRSSELVGLGQALWQAADDALGALAEGHLEAQRLVVRGEEAARLRFVDDLLGGQADVGSLVERAQPFGLQLAAAHVVAVARADPPLVTAGRLTDWVEQAARDRFPGRGVLVTVKDGRLVCALSVGPLRSAPRSDADGQLLAELAGGATAELARGAVWRVAVSRPHSGPMGVSRCFAEALDALRVADLLDLPDPVVHARQLLVYRVLLRDETAMADLVEAVLGPLTGARDGPERLLQTLEAYFAAGGNTAAAARRLHLSVRALSYRLNRIALLTGYRAGDPAHALPLHVAVTGARLLDWPRRPLAHE